MNRPLTTSRCRITQTSRRFRPRVVSLEERAVPATFTVTNVADSGAGSLRQAVLDANANPGADTIAFAPTVAGTIQLQDIAFDITEELTIQGPGSSVLGLDGNGNGIFTTFEPMTVSGLKMFDGTADPWGGAFRSHASLTLSDCVFSNNVAGIPIGGGRGGAIFHQGSSLLIERCEFSGNRTAGPPFGYGEGGGAIWTTGNVVIRDSSFSGNISYDGGAIKFGGGSLTVEGCTFQKNSVDPYYGWGGAVWGLGLFRNCTFTENTASVGGAIFLSQGVGAIGLLQNCTVVNNSAPTINGGQGGGVAGNVTLESTIVSGNTGHLGIAWDIAGKVTATNSAIGSAIGITAFTDHGGNLPFGTHLKMAPISNNGGPTLTIALLAGSPCINAGSNPAGLATDQRGDGYPRVVGKAADIGAFEVQGLPPAIMGIQINDGSAQRSSVTSLAVTFDRAVTLPANPADAFQLKRQSDDAPVTLSASMLGSTVTLTFTGGPVNGASLADGRYTLMALASQINDGIFDGNGDGTTGDDYVLVSSGTGGVFRLFGDNDGDADTDKSDFDAFRTAFGGNSQTFDFDNDGDVDATDFGQFRMRFGATL